MAHPPNSSINSGTFRALPLVYSLTHTHLTVWLLSKNTFDSNSFSSLLPSSLTFSSTTLPPIASIPLTTNLQPPPPSRTPSPDPSLTTLTLKCSKRLAFFCLYCPVTVYRCRQERRKSFVWETTKFLAGMKLHTLWWSGGIHLIHQAIKKPLDVEFMKW